METTYILSQEMKKFIKTNRDRFENKLLSEAVNVASNINDILKKGNIDLLKNAKKLILYVVEQHDEELTEFANQEGIAWAEHSLTLSFKLEWVQAIRRTLWHFLYQLDQPKNLMTKREEYYDLEKMINDRVDKFLNTFFLSYSTYKDEMLNNQRKLVEHLSVPIIPVSPSVSVLPLIGTIDSYRIQTIEEKVLFDIATLRVQTLVMDLSGIATMDMDVIDHFQRVLTGVSMMGCKAVLTGLRPELVRKMIHAGIRFDNKAETKGTLQETLKKYLSFEQN
ncbi:STAS domain-containing protein [Neobacillus terrae]|uniref:STAS domain-containing protein n=1 Tax=Neobacillus terrae TaxID=3034837 RepID=UPI00140DD6B0|nr:STAS domain-containing protein [Neobacillus terrae]NHM32104.1 STAS domain-containing protein [Neobacillus terrae]